MKDKIYALMKEKEVDLLENKIHDSVLKQKLDKRELEAKIKCGLKNL